MNADVVRNCLALPRVCELAQHSDLPETAVTPLLQYLRALPGYDDSNAREGFLSNASMEQHGIIALPLTEILH